MLNFKLGHIGKNEIERAIKVLEENKDIKKIFVRISHNDEVRGAEYDSIEELLSDEDCIYSFSSKEEYIKYLEEEVEEQNTEILDLLENGAVYCDSENDRISNDIEDIVKPLIEDGKSHMYYSYEDALDNLNGKYVNEALVVFLCNEY